MGSRLANSIVTRDVMLLAHRRVDLAVLLRLTRALELRGAVDKVLDTRYDDSLGFRARGTLFRIGISLEK